MSRSITVGVPLVVWLAATTPACTTPEVEPAGWTIPIPEGTPAIEHRPVSPQDRAGNRIELVRDLVIGDGAAVVADRRFHFVDGWRNLAVGARGDIYVVDSRNYRVQVFDARGNYVRTLGPRGQGPGEIARPPRAIAIVGDRVVVGQPSTAWVDEWTVSGGFVGRRDLGVGSWITRFAGTDDGDLIGAWETTYEGDDWRNLVQIGRPPADGVDGLVYLEHVDREVPGDITDLGANAPLVLLGAHRPSFAAGRDGAVYVSAGDEYQILSLDVSGRARWAMRVASPRRLPTRGERVRLIEQIRGAGATPDDRAWFADVARRGLAVTGAWPAVGKLEVDGHGHLYVFPPVPQLPGTYDERPVDVYAADGERLFSGFIPVPEFTIGREGFIVSVLTPMLPPGPSWEAARDDHIFRIEQDPGSGEGIVVRYRLVEPF